MTQHPSVILENKRVGLLGKLGAMTRKEACQWLKQHRATVAEKLAGSWTWSLSEPMNSPTRTSKPCSIRACENGSAWAPQS